MNQCTECPNSRILNENNSCICKQGFFENPGMSLECEGK
jgi:hypothetical protein